MNLTSQQREAIEHKEGPLLIIAGAGTGKTLAITHRIAHLILTQKARPEEILALTFTERTANEMEERVDVLVPMGSFGYHISTFHSFGERVLREHALTLGLTTDFRVLSKPEQVIFFLEHLFEFNLDYYRPLSNPTRHIEAILTLISRAKDEDIGPEEYLAYAKKLAKRSKARPEDKALAELAQQQTELAVTYQTYQRLLIQEGLVDFGDLVVLPLKLFRTHPLILKQYQERFRFILVDEFQDTNFAQFQVVHLLAEGHRNIVVVGDDDQSIYKFRGAAISNILNFKMEYPKAKKVVLTVNYRSTKSILSGAYDLIQNNNPDRLEVKLKINKRLTPERDFQAKEKSTIVQLPSGEAEVDFTLKKILALLAKENYTYKDFAILTRANKQLDPYLAGLRRMGLPYQLIGNRGLFDQSEVRNLMQFLRVVANPDDSVALFQLLTFEPKGIQMGKVLGILHQAKLRRTSLWNLLKVSDDE